MGKADLHAHTCHDSWGDGNQGVEELFRYVEEETDLALFAITDHDSTDAARAGWEIHQRGGYRFDFLPGVEVTNLAGHLLCYFPDGRISDIPSLRPFWWTVQYAQERGAICIPAHPVYPPWLQRTIAHGLDRGLRLQGLEAINAAIPRAAQVKLDQLAGRMSGRLSMVANSDAHDETSLGSAYTEFPGETREDFLAALRDDTTRPVFVRQSELHPAARAFTTRRSMTRPGWVRNIWREAANRTIRRMPL